MSADPGAPSRGWHDRLPLRLRVGLFFALIAAAGIAAFAAGLVLAAGKLAPGTETGRALVLAGVVGGLGLAAATLWVWLMFDEHVARPLLRLSSDLGARAGAPIDGALSEAAPYLGALAPAAERIVRALEAARTEAEARAEARAAETARATRRLEAVLDDLDEGVLVCTPGHRIALHNRAARALLAGEVGLDRDVRRLLPAAPLEAALSRLGDGHEGFEAAPEGASQPLRVAVGRVRGPDGVPEGYVLALRPAAETPAAERPAPVAPPAARPEFYDFSLLDRAPAAPGAAPLAEQVFVVFDTETTGLEPARGDALVQIGAFRIAGGRLLEGERFDTLVDPGRPIPPRATEVHGLSAADVAGAPSPPEAAAAFHRFADGAVLVAHNAPFDLAFLSRAAPPGLAFDHAALDTVLLSAALFPHEADHTLDALAARLGVTVPAALRHTALGDARATAEAFLRLLPLLDAEGVRDLAAVEALQARQTRLRRAMAGAAGGD